MLLKWTSVLLELQETSLGVYVHPLDHKLQAQL